MNTYEKYIGTIEENTPQYVTDCEGNMHDLSGDLRSKIDTIKKSRSYWENVLKIDPENEKALRFYKKFSGLLVQIRLLTEGHKVAFTIV